MRDKPQYRYDRLKIEPKKYLIIKQNIEGGPWTIFGNAEISSPKLALNRVRRLNEGKSMSDTKTLEDIARKTVKAITALTDGHSTTDFDGVVNMFTECGFDLTLGEDSKGHKVVVIQSPAGFESQKLWGQTWQENFEMIKRGSLYFCLLEPGKENEKPEYRFSDSNKPVTNFDAEGSPKTKKSWYAVVKYREQIPFMCGWCVDSPEERAKQSVSGGVVASAASKLLTGETSQATGKGFYFNQCVRNIVRIYNPEAS